MIETESGKLYTGISTNIERRFNEHANVKGGKGAKFFRSDKPKAVVYCEACDNRSVASRREAVVKKMTRQQKKILVASK